MHNNLNDNFETKDTMLFECYRVIVVVDKIEKNRIVVRLVI